MTICAKCVHGLFKGQICYDQFCRASKRKKVMNPVTGEKGFASSNDLGKEVITEQEYEFCRDINFGNCDKFVNNRR